MVPLLHRYLELLRLPDVRPGALQLPLACRYRLARRRHRDLPGSWGAPCSRAAFSDPGGPGPSRPDEEAWYCLPASCDAVGPTPEFAFEAQSRGPVARCLRFAARVTPGLAQDSLPACWLGVGRTGFPPAGLLPRVLGWHRSSPPLEPGFPGAPQVQILSPRLKAAELLDKLERSAASPFPLTTGSARSGAAVVIGTVGHRCNQRDSLSGVSRTTHDHLAESQGAAQNRCAQSE